MVLICDLFLFVRSTNCRLLFGSYSTAHARATGVLRGEFLNVITREKSIALPPQINIWSGNRYKVPLAGNVFITFPARSPQLSSISMQQRLFVFICPRPVFCIPYQRIICLVCKCLDRWQGKCCGWEPVTGSPPFYTTTISGCRNWLIRVEVVCQPGFASRQIHLSDIID